MFDSIINLINQKIKTREENKRIKKINEKNKNEKIFYVHETRGIQAQLDLVEQKKKELNIEDYTCEFSYSTYVSGPKYFFKCIKED
ncbi:MAG: hypothetical protein CMF62_01320 [Magnetococcales bacterium]|nr:hypothetical protein [Magnetococcales bacterium]MBA42634.1 hypothetical protein [Magnetococcales bacterium]|tara:strand:+ start:6489 stop:6746 length:258 start_codon:yes stop_codon:yes gene_type:complete